MLNHKALLAHHVLKSELRRAAVLVKAQYLQEGGVIDIGYLVEHSLGLIRVLSAARGHLRTEEDALGQVHPSGRGVCGDAVENGIWKVNDKIRLGGASVVIAAVFGEHEEKLTHEGANLRLHAQVEAALGDKLGQCSFPGRRLSGDSVFAVILLRTLVGIEQFSLGGII